MDDLTKRPEFWDWITQKDRKEQVTQEQPRLELPLPEHRCPQVETPTKSDRGVTILHLY